jgi:multidrug transporter EmrE-like cation transporter
MKYGIALVLALVLNAAANLMMKFGSVGLRDSLQADPRRDAGTLAGMLAHNWILVLGLFFFATNVLLYTYALQVIKISVAYPIMVSGGFAIIALVAWLGLKETLTPVQWGGIALILIGVYLVARDVKVMAS